MKAKDMKRFMEIFLQNNPEYTSVILICETKENCIEHNCILDKPMSATLFLHHMIIKTITYMGGKSHDTGND